MSAASLAHGRVRCMMAPAPHGLASVLQGGHGSSTTHITSAALVLTHGFGAVGRVAAHGWELIRDTTDRYSSRFDVMCGAERLLLAPHPPHEMTLTTQSQRTGGRPKRARLGAASVANAERQPRASRHEMCLDEQARNPTGHTNRHGPRGNIYECCQPTSPPCEPSRRCLRTQAVPPSTSIGFPVDCDFRIPMA